MNYMWEVLLKAQEENVSTKNITFLPATSLNPYIETSFYDLNPCVLDNAVEINAYYRFGEIFQNLIGGQLADYPEIEKALFAVLIQFLGELDIHQGLCKKEYYGLFLKEDTNKGIYGKNFANVIDDFPFYQRRIVVENMVKLYSLGSSIQLLRFVLQRLYESSLVYLDSVDKKTLLVYIGIKENTSLNVQVKFILELFVPIDYTIKLFWEMHFGLIGVGETMIVDDIAIY